MSKLSEFLNFSSTDPNEKNLEQDKCLTSETPRSYDVCVHEFGMTHQKMVSNDAIENLDTVNLGDVSFCSPGEATITKPIDPFNIICGTASQHLPLDDSVCFKADNQDDSITSSYSFLNYKLVSPNSLTSESGVLLKSQPMDLNYKLVSDCDLFSKSQEAFPPSSPTSSNMEQPGTKEEVEILNEILSDKTGIVYSEVDVKSLSSTPQKCIFQNPLSSRTKRLKLLISHERFVTIKFIRLKTKYRRYIRQFKLGPPTNFRFPPPFTSEFFNLRNTRYYTIDYLKQKCGIGRSKQEYNDPITLESNAYRLNTANLAKLLNLQNYSYELTKEVELNILEIFKIYCKFDVGFQTWIRDTTMAKRSNLINHLYLLTYYFYPELSKTHLEAIIRKGIYTMMQYRLRNSRERRRITTCEKKTARKPTK